MTLLRHRMSRNEPPEARFMVVHPLDDHPEAKAATTSLGPMPMTRTVWWALITLRAYVIIMMLLVVSQFLTLAGLIGHYAP